ncbi:MAG: ISAzo13-like element transposase-related protein, partial [Candidatus Limnocylindria bacterium]
MIDEGAIRDRYAALAPVVDERARRLLLGAEALAAGRGGQRAVVRATGASPATIRRGMRELAEPPADLQPGRVRRPGGGRKRSVDLDPTLRRDLEALIEPTSRGDPISPLRWTTKSLRRLAAELQRGGHQVSYRIVADLLGEL